MKWLKGWPVWLLMAVIVVVTLVATAGHNGPRTNAERVTAIAKTIKCPVCSGESVDVSQSDAAKEIRDEIARQVQAGQSDGQVRAYFAQRLGQEYLLTPPSSGLEGLVWVLPVVALVLAIGGLAVAFARWRAQLHVPPPDDDDRALVAAALDAAHDAEADDHGEGEGR